jgi:Uma2 family endonuclease
MATRLSEAAAHAPWISFEEFLSTYDGVHAEWVDGTVIVMSPGSARHSVLTRFISSVLQGYAEQKGLGTVYVPAFSMRLPDRRSGREPDVFFVADANSGRVHDRYVEGAADVVVEIVSPDSRTRDRAEKLAEYERGGVPEYWIVDPLAQRVDCWWLGEGGRYEAAPLGDPPMLRSRVMPGLWLDPEWLWSERPPAQIEVFRAWGLL